MLRQPALQPSPLQLRACALVTPAAAAGTQRGPAHHSHVARQRQPNRAVVAQRPRELTRKQLKDLKLALDRAGFDEPSLRTAWRQRSNVDIAASILGYIRQAALGDALVPYGQRVDRALTSILASRAWDVHQTKWLRRIAEQMKASTVVDQAALSDRPFLDAGGFPRLNKIFDGQLEAVLEDLKERVWKEGA